MTNEIGQCGRTPEAVTRSLTVLAEEHVAWALWFDHDGDPAQALHEYHPGDFDPARDLRPNGDAFRRWVEAAVIGAP